jgi:exodeoxyribonuclease V beta subunit
VATACARSGDAIALAGLWSGPDALAEDMEALCGPLPLRPARNAPRPMRRRRTCRRRPRLADAIIAHGDAYFADVLATIDAGMLNKNTYKTDWVQALQRELRGWSRHPDPAIAFGEKLDKLTHEALAKARRRTSPARPRFRHCSRRLPTGWPRAKRHLAWRMAASMRLLHNLRKARGRPRARAACRPTTT